MARRLTVLMLFFTLMLYAGCTFTITPPASTPRPEISANGVIFTAAQSEANVDAVGGNVTETWTPTAADVAQLEADLPAFLQGAQDEWLRTDPPIWERASDYMRQYLGIVEDDTQLIYANFFCAADHDDWRTTFVFVMDGGDCYFQLKYNPQTREFSAFSVNGEA
jgi:hypothetical protein